MPSPRALAPLLVLLVLTACSGSEPTPDAGTEDSGVTVDAGTGTDSGITDAGSTDAGGTDAGGTDAGGPDAGGTDAGGTDAGTDAGPPLAITTDALTDAYVGQAYSVTLSATGGVAPYAWSIAEGTLPAGLVLDSTGRLTGTPTTATPASFTVGVQDSTGVTARANLTLAIYAPPALSAVPASTRQVGDDVSERLVVSGGKSPFTFSSSGTPPPGLTVTPEGFILGTLSQAGTFSFTVTATDANGVPASRGVSITVQPRFAITTNALPVGTRGGPYQFTLTSAYGRARLSWSLDGTLPAGVTLSSEGVLSGTPAELGSFTFTVTVHDADSRQASRQLTLTVRNPGSPVFTVGHWNITHFGSDTLGPSRSTSDGGTPDDLQLANARDLMRDAGANLWGMVEMVDTADFDLLRSQLPGFSGFLSNNPALVPGGASHYGSSSQKLGVLYDSALTFQSAQLILTSQPQKDDFGGRPPLRVDFTTEIQGVETPLTVIVVHMRAESADPTAPRESRQRASAALQAYLDQNLPGQHVLVVGDWNDDVDESITLDRGSGLPLPTPYGNFVMDPERYSFITRPLSLAGDDTSIGFENVVDHTLATNELAARHVAGSARVVYADSWVPDFLDTVSDHRPVLSAYALSAETGPYLRLKAPQGGTYQAGSVLPVTWTSFAVSDVRVEASLNDGTDWSVLAASVPAVQGRYLWTLPDLASSIVRVRVVDVSNPERADTSDAALTLVQGPGRVFINEVLLDEQPNSTAFEFVELVNASPFPVDLSGWAIWDVPDNAANRRHVFANGTTLAPGKALVVFGGTAGIPPGRTNAVAASSSTLGLNNSGDTVRLRLADGGVVDQMTYGASADSVSVNRGPDATPDAGFVPHNTLPSGFNSSPGQRSDRTEF